MSHRRLRRGYLRAFTLVELMLVVVCISILTTVAIPGYSALKGRTRHAEFVQQMELLVQQLHLFWRSNGVAPGTDPTFVSTALNPTTPAGGQAPMDWTIEPWRSVARAVNAPIDNTRMRYRIVATPSLYYIEATHDFNADGITGISYSTLTVTADGRDFARVDSWADMN